MLNELLRKALDMGDLVFIKTRYEFRELSDDLTIGHGKNTYGLYVKDNNGPRLPYLIEEDADVTGWFLLGCCSTAPVDEALVTDMPELGLHLACFYFGDRLLITEGPLRDGTPVRWSSTVVKFRQAVQNDK